MNEPGHDDLAPEDHVSEPQVVQSHVQQGERVEMTAIECRVVGAMIEKAATTPDVYPMTTNAMVSACNQKTNRDPVVKYDAVTIDAALMDLRQRNLVRRVHTPGSRSTKHRQTLNEVLTLDDAQLAVVAVLMLRGPQTVGELRQRTERQYSFASLEEVEACLASLAGRNPAIVQRLARQPGQKEARWQHLLSDEASQASSESGSSQLAADSVRVESQPVASAAAPAPAPSQPAPSQPAPSQPAPSQPAPRPSANAVRSQSAGLVDRVRELEAEVATLRSQLERLAASLGETLDP